MNIEQSKSSSGPHTQSMIQSGNNIPSQPGANNQNIQVMAPHLISNNVGRTPNMFHLQQGPQHGQGGVYNNPHSMTQQGSHPQIHQSHNNYDWMSHGQPNPGYPSQSQFGVNNPGPQYIQPYGQGYYPQNNYFG